MNSNQGTGFLNSIPFVTRNIIIINVLVWLACNILIRTNIDLVSVLSMHYYKSADFHLYQLITYMFTHVDLAHLFFNMFALYMFGSVLENRWGTKRFLTYYFITGLGAALIQMVVYHFRINALAAELPSEALWQVYNEGADILRQHQNYVNSTMASLNLLFNSNMLGASGAVFGLLLAFGMLYPNVELFIIFIPVPIKAKYFVVGYGLIELLLGFANFSGDRVAHFAHLGGMLFGIFLILYWRKKDRKDGRFFN